MPKKPNTSWLIYALVAILVAIGVCASIIVYLTLIKTPANAGPDVIDNVNATNEAQKITTTTTVLETTMPVVLSTTTVSSTTTMEIVKEVEEEEEEGKDEVAITEQPKEEGNTEEQTEEVTETITSTTESTTTTTTQGPEIVLPVDVNSIIHQFSVNDELIETCSKIQPAPIKCDHQAIAEKFEEDSFSPIHYSLNLTIRDVRKPVIEGSIMAFAKTQKDTRFVVLNAAKLHKTDRIRVINCETGESICVQHVSQDLENELLVAHLAQPVTVNSIIRIDINNFVSADASNAVYKQIPTAKWRVPTMVGAVFEPRTARRLFPSFDDNQHKATFDVCIAHAPSMTALSNSRQASNDGSTTCFARSLPLTSQQVAFVAYEKASNIVYNSTNIEESVIPTIEIVFNMNTNLKQHQHDWIYKETSMVISLLSKWFAFNYPLDKLSMVVAPVMTGHSALGIVTLPAQAVAYQKHTSTHETLIKEIIGQWMEGIVNTDDTCFEKAIIAYLEWKINEQLQIVKKTRKDEIARIRPRNLNETQDSLRVIRNVANTQRLCSPRYVEVFYTLDETFGQDTVIGMIREIFAKFSFSTATVDDWADAARRASGRDEAGQMITQWFSTITTRPIIRVVVQSQLVEFEQLTNETWTVPAEVSGSSGTQLITISERKQSIPFISNDYVVIDPARKSNAFFVYDSDTYLRLIRCFSDTRCPSKQISGVFSDLAAALVANMLPAPSDQHEIVRWKSVFKFMAQQNLVDGTAACCVEHAIREMRKCSYWDVQDVCTKIQFNIVMSGQS